jgi:hypothetical protein
VSLADDLRHALGPAVWAEEALGLELDPWQRDVIRSPGKRDLLNVTRQGGKSTVAAVLALHQALYRPNSLTLLVSPSLRQSSELFRKVTDLRAQLPAQPVLSEDNRLSLAVAGGGRIVSLPGSEATVRGFSGASLIVEDEAARVDDALYMAVRPMLATSGGRLILMSTPFGKRGHYWKEWSEGSTWQRTEIPATKVPRISADFLEEEKNSMGLWWFEQEYLCQFKEATDSVFTHDEITRMFSDHTIKPLFQEGAE